MSTTPYTYVFVRTDLPVAQQIVQSAHACHEAGNKFGEHSHVVLFECPSEHKLVQISATLTDQQIPHTLFHEPDDDVGYTAICTTPLVGEQRKVMRKYRMYPA